MNKTSLLQFSDCSHRLCSLEPISVYDNAYSLLINKMAQILWCTFDIYLRCSPRKHHRIDVIIFTHFLHAYLCVRVCVCVIEREREWKESIQVCMQWLQNHADVMTVHWIIKAQRQRNEQAGLRMSVNIK